MNAPIPDPAAPALVSALEMLTIALPAGLPSLASLAGSPVTIDRELESLWSIEPGAAGERCLLTVRDGVTLRLVRGSPRRRSRPVAARWPHVATGTDADLDALATLLADRAGAVRLVTTRFERCRRFYLEALGLAAIDGRAVPAVASEPAPLERAVLAATAATTPRALLAIEGFAERDVDPERASWTDLDGGVCIVSLTSAHFDTAFAAIESSRDTLVLARPRPVEAHPYHGRRVFCFLGPDGERIEILEAAH